MDQSYGVAALSVIPIREQASHKSQQVTQLLFGETYQVIEYQKDWLFIKCLFDGYEGYIDISQHFKIVQPFSSQNFSTSAIGLVTVNDKPIRLSMGSALPNVSKKKFEVEKLFGEIIDLEIVEASLQFNEERFRQVVMQWLEVPYLWGGKSIFGVDCSGFVQTVFKLFRYNLLRDAHQQVSIGEEVYFVEQCKLGDIAFFENEEGKITHVGIMLNNREIIHASGKVKINAIDQNGIFDKNMNKYTHKLRILKRIIK